MEIPGLKSTRTSLRRRILLASLVVVALALAIAATAFERVARSVVVDAVHSHLAARAKEIQEAVVRFQRERALTVGNWAEAEAMQMTLDSGDAKFAEDYLRRTIQDQGGTLTAGALVSVDGVVLAMVRDAPQGERRGIPLADQRGKKVDLKALRGSAGGDDVSVTLAPLSSIVHGGEDLPGLVMTAPVKDFASDLVGWVVAALPARAISTLLDDVNGKGGLYVPLVADRDRRLVVTLPRVDAGQLQAALAPPASAPGALERVDGDRSGLLAVRTAAAAEVPGWSTVMIVGESEVDGRLRKLRSILAGVFAIVLGGAAFAAVGSLRRASRPLSDVAASMARVAGGDLSTRVREEYTDELGHLVTSFNTMVAEVERSRDELQRTEALRKEVQIAHQIQTAILPVSPAVKGFEVAARMKPADDVGGDLYDILAFEDGFWVIVGDVSGHGINSGLVMMMAQAAAYGAIAEDPGCSPRQVIATVNRVVHENVRRRMRRDDYLTLMAARYLGDGRFVAAGAHQPIFIARQDRVDVVEGRGPWVGLAADLASAVPEYEFTVGKGELLCFITDGIVEAHDAAAQLYGDDRLAAVLARKDLRSASHALGEIFSSVEAFAAEQKDDMTAVVLRRKNGD